MSVSPMIVKYEKTLARNPRSQVFAPLSELYRKIGLMDKSRDVLQAGIRFNPDYIPGYIELANYYIDLREFNLAHATLRPLVNSNRDNIKLQKLFVLCCTELEYKSEALDTLKYLLFLNPKDKEIAERIQELEKEELVVTEFSEEKPIKFDIDSLNTQKLEEEDYGDWVEVNTAKKIEEEEDSLDVGWNIENINTPENENTIDKNEDTDGPRANHALAEIYLEQGHVEKAKEVVEKILEIQPKDQETIDKLEEINLLLSSQDNSLEEEKEFEVNNLDLKSVKFDQLEDVPAVKENKDFNTGSLMEVFDKKIASFNQSDAEIVGDYLEQFLNALRGRGDSPKHP